MLLDEIFEKDLPTETVFVRKNGAIDRVSKPIHVVNIEQKSTPPLFPITKDRK